MLAMLNPKKHVGGGGGDASSLGVKTTPASGMEDSIEWLRRIQERWPLSEVLGSVSFALVAGGVFWGLWLFLQAHPYLLCIALGFVGLLLALAALPGGLMRWLDQGTQDFLLKGTIFDLLHDDSSTQNTIRRWGRMLMMAMVPEPTPAKVRTITEGLDPTFVDGVFRKTFIHRLPRELKTLLLPSQRRRLGWRPGSAEDQVLQTIAAGAGSVGPSEDLGGPPLTPQRVVRLIKEKEAAKNLAITEPELGPAIRAACNLDFGTLWVKAWETSVALTRQVSCALWVTSLSCLGTAVVLRLPQMQKLILRGLTVYLGERGGNRMIADGVRQAGRMAGILGMFGLGGALLATAVSASAASLHPEGKAAASPQQRIAELEAKVARQAEENKATLARLAVAERRGEAGSETSTADSPAEWPEEACCSHID